MRLELTLAVGRENGKKEGEVEQGREGEKKRKREREREVHRVRSSCSVFRVRESKSRLVELFAENGGGRG